MNRTGSTGNTGARQVDWHLMLPQAGRPFNHLLLLGGSRAIGETIIELGIARRVSHKVETSAEADAVVILAGATGDINDAVGQLAEDGVLYWEIDRRTREHVTTTPSRALSRIHALGLTSTGSYWVKPGFPNRNMFMPLNAAGACRWYLDTLFRTPTLVRRAFKAIAQLGASLFSGVSAFAPCYAVTAVRGAASPPALVELARNATQSVHSENLEAVMLASGEADWSRIVVLVFEAGADRPSAAVKLPRLAPFNEHIEREHQVIAELDAIAPRPPVPQSALFHWNGLAVSVETCVSGSSLNSRIGSSTRAALDDLRATAGWLSRFHEQTGEATPARA